MRLTTPRNLRFFSNKYGAKISNTFWLINGVVMALPRSQIRSLSREPGIQYIERSAKPIGPPANNSIDVRNLLETDQYYSFDDTYIGILDSGVRYTHELLSYRTSPAGGLGYAVDCVNGTGPDCYGGTDPGDEFNHGTSTASELTAGNQLGNNDRGVTQDIVDSYKVYSGGVESVPAIVRAYQAAVDFGDRLLVADIQDSGGPTGMVSTASDAVFAQNVAVFAAAGNNGPGTDTVTAPGNSHFALAIGAADVTSGVLESYSGRGPTLDGRTKPDLLGPTNVNAASNVSDTAMQMFTGTSAATPNIAGAAALLRSLIKGTSTYDLAPGILYATMIGSGQNVGGADDNNNGAGMVKMSNKWTHVVGGCYVASQWNSQRAVVCEWIN